MHNHTNREFLQAAHDVDSPYSTLFSLFMLVLQHVDMYSSLISVLLNGLAFPNKKHIMVFY